jgi:hypothetical protein
MSKKLSDVGRPCSHVCMVVYHTYRNIRRIQSWKNRQLPNVNWACNACHICLHHVTVTSLPVPNPDPIYLNLSADN